MLKVFHFFSDNKTNDYKIAAFRADWAALDDESKEQLKNGIENGTLTY